MYDYILDSYIQEELDSANAKYPPFASLHEGYGVLAEEFEETAEEVSNIKIELHEAWRNIKKDIYPEYQISRMRHHSRQLIREAFQVAAMVEKMSKLKQNNEATDKQASSK